MSKSLSTASMIHIASTGSHIEINTVVSMSIPAPGIQAAQIEARIIIMTIVICCANDKSIPTTWEINNAAQAWYKAVPSMLTVVQIGKVNFTTSSESFAFSLATLIDTHIVALLEDVENATKIASLTLKKYFFGLNQPRKYQIAGRVTKACIVSHNNDTHANGRSFTILSNQLCATTQETIANTHRGVSFITQEIKVSIQLFNVSVSVFNCKTSSFFQYAIRAIPRMIPIVTICIALSSMNATIILSGIIERRKPEKLSASSLSALKFSKSKLTHFQGAIRFISKREVVIARVVVSI